MKTILLFLLLLAAPVLSAQGRGPLDRFCANVSQSCTELTYTYTARVSGISTAGQGTLSSQDMMWVVKGNGVEMFCDSESTWVVDPSSKEVVIEAASSDPEGSVISNPALMVAMLDKLFTVTESLPSEDAGAVLYVLKPKSESTIDFFNVEILKSDSSVRRASFSLNDGTLVKIEVSSMKLTPKVSVSRFRPATDFDSSWIVTDLR